MALLYYQLYNLKEDLKSEVTVAKDHARDTNEKLTSLEQEMSQIRQDQSSAGSVLARLESQISACTTEFAANFGAGSCPEQCVADYPRRN